MHWLQGRVLQSASTEDAFEFQSMRGDATVVQLQQFELFASDEQGF
jgi:hypothetical protein